MLIKAKKGQVSIEFLFVVGFAFLITAGLAYLFLVQSESINSGISSSQIDKVASEIRDAADQVYYLGPPSKKTLTLYFPDSIDSVAFYGNSIIFNVTGSHGHYEVVKWAASNYSITSSILSGSGIHHVSVEARTYDILVTE
jgi:uncharacterized protein (UPF0333 family)